MCCWARNFEPVPGWDAIPTIVSTDYPSDSYLVMKCPKFKPDDPAREPKKLDHGATMKDLCKRWRCGQEFVRKCIDEGMPFRTVGKLRYFDIKKCESWMRG